MVDNPFTKAAAIALLAGNDFWLMHICSKDSDFDKSHQLTGQYYERLSVEADMLMELAMEQNQPVFNPTDALNIVENWSPERRAAYDYGTIVDVSKSIILQYISALRELRNSTDRTDIESRVDDILGYWEKELNYKLARRTNILLSGFVNTGLDDALVQFVTPPKTT